MSGRRSSGLAAAAALLVCGLLRTPAVFGDTSAIPVRLTAPIFMVAEMSTGTVLLEQFPDTPIPPASLAKLMTLHLTLQDVSAGRLEPLKAYRIPPEAAASAMKASSSVMGLREGDRVTVLTLQRAAAAVSANDAAWALALFSEGSPQAFVSRMNREAGRLGMSGTVFTDPDGWSGMSRTTARDMMALARTYVAEHPGVLGSIHSREYLEYLDQDDIDYRYPYRNTNLLLGRVEGVDGLKTGTIPSAGFHFLATAQRNGVRFIALVMGVQAGVYAEGLERRSREAEALLEWAFENFTVISLKPHRLFSVPVRHGEAERVNLVPAGKPPQAVTVRHGGPPVLMLADVPQLLEAPLSPGTNAGSVRWFLEERQIGEANLVVEQGVGRRWKLRDLFR